MVGSLKEVPARFAGESTFGGSHMGNPQLWIPWSRKRMPPRRLARADFLSPNSGTHFYTKTAVDRGPPTLFQHGQGRDCALSPTVKAHGFRELLQRSIASGVPTAYDHRACWAELHRRGKAAEPDGVGNNNGPSPPRDLLQTVFSARNNLARIPQTFFDCLGLLMVFCAKFRSTHGTYRGCKRLF
jgi:hypothetical protein